MTRQRSILLTAAAAAVALAGATSFAQEQPTTTTQAPAPAVFVPSQLAPAPAPNVVVPVADLKPLVEPIQNAADPSAAIAAYARASSAAGNNLAVQDAYMRKMVGFNLPEMAESQAKEILKQDPRNEVAIAVVSYMQGRRGQAVDALATIVQAANVTDQVTGEPFVLRTAGQLVAWYDTRADKQTIPDALRNDVEALRKKLSSRDDFGLAYAGARDAYLGRTPGTADAQAQQQPAQLQAQSQVPAYTPSGASTVAAAAVDYQPQVVEIPSSNAYTYAEPYYYEPYYYPAYYSSPFLYSGFYYGSYYNPCYSSVIIHDKHHHGHGHDGHHGGRDWDNDGHHGGGVGGGRSWQSPNDNRAPRVHRYDDVRDRGGSNRPAIPDNDGKIVWSNPVAPTQAQIYQNNYQEGRSSDVVRTRANVPTPRIGVQPSSRIQPTPSQQRIQPAPSQRIQPVRTSPTPSRSVDRPSSPSRSAAPSSPSRSSPSQSSGGGASRSSSRAR